MAPPAENGYAFKFHKRISSHSFDPSLRVKSQSFRTSTSRASFLEKTAENNKVEPAEVEPADVEPAEVEPAGTAEEEKEEQNSTWMWDDVRKSQNLAWFGWNVRLCESLKTQFLNFQMQHISKKSLCIFRNAEGIFDCE